jgi:hypothetical protein
MKIMLNAGQVELLRPYLDRVKAAAALGSPGMLVAQISHDQEGGYALTPAFLDHDLAKVITEKGRADIPGAVGDRKVLERRRVGRPPDIPQAGDAK